MPVYAGVGISTNEDYKSAVAEAVSQAKVNLNQEEISLAILFTSFEFAFSYLLRAIGNLIGPDVPLLGTTSSAILTKDGILKHGIAIALISAKNAYFNVVSAKNVLADLFAGGDRIGKQLLFGMKDVQRRFCLIFSDGQIVDNAAFLKGLQQRLGRSFPIIGANAASDNISNKTFQYFNRETLTRGAVGVLWAGRIGFGLGIKHGWKPIGKPHLVTSSDNFIIKEIEEKPAASLYQDYFAKDILELKKELKRISCLYPIGINISGEEEYLLRNILFIRDDGSLICRGDVPENSRVRLMIGTKESSLAATEEAALEAKQSLNMQAFPKKEKASIILVFNSASRLYLLGRQFMKELEIIESHFPGTPILGLCTLGEQAPLKTTDFAGKTYCHNQTIAILAIS
ncbi:MAG: FIST C-terminal domain-containing protein [Actinobacteria bacterium]|nr:FIST C-terminal domain-containing protein [Actinomycetota bacterium]